MSTITIRRLTVSRHMLPFRLRFSHNLASRDSGETLLVEAETSGGSLGWGQVLPRGYLTGESLESCMEDINDRWNAATQALKFDLVRDARGILDVLNEIYGEADRSRRNAAFAGVDVAVVDAVCREAGIAGGVMWGGMPEPLPLVGVVPASGAGKAAWMAWMLRRLGYRRFKVKVGRDRGADDMRVAAVRKAIGSGAWLAVDANAAWDCDEALERIAGLSGYGVSLVEEPLRRGSGSMMTLGELERRSGMPLMADESLCTLADAERLLSEGSPSWWNLRLGKIGGFSGLRALARLAADNGVNVYGGVLVGETSCLAAAGRAGMGLAGFACMEYGFPRILLKNDPFRGGPGGFSGRAEPLSPRVFGLGVRILR